MNQHAYSRIRISMEDGSNSNNELRKAVNTSYLNSDARPCWGQITYQDVSAGEAKDVVEQA